MIELDLRGACDVDQLRNLRVGRRRGRLVGGLGGRVLGSTGVGWAEDYEPEAQKSRASKRAGSSHPYLPWAGADGLYLVSSSVESPAGWSCISLKTACSFSFVSWYLLYSSTSCCESAVRPISR